MTITVKVDSIGEVGVSPRLVRIHTTDSVATVLTAGYLNKIQNQGIFIFNESDLCAVVTRESAGAPENSGWYEISKSNNVFSLVPIASPGNVKLPTIPNALSYFMDATGKSTSDAANVTHDGDIHATSMQAGQNGSGGFFKAYSPDLSGEFTLDCLNNGSGNFGTTLRPIANYAQNQTVVIPDAGTSTANILLDAGANNIISFESFLGIDRAIIADSNPSTVVRRAAGDWVLRKTGGISDDYISFDISEDIRTASNKGFRLNGFNVIYNTTVSNLLIHVVLLRRVGYANNVAITNTSIPYSGALALGIQDNPYVSSFTINTPLFNNTSNSKQVIEIRSQTDTTTVYDFIGIVMKFSKTIA